MRRWLAVISDLHISEGSLDDFDDELEAHLINFLGWLGGHPEPAELVINGDFLDFVQATPWSGRNLEAFTADGIPLCFSEEQSREKLRNIKAAHEKTFSALANFLARQSGNRLVILPGNHDCDFFWGGVRKDLSSALGLAPNSIQLKFCLQRYYKPHDMPWLHIEHGHQFDKANCFYVSGHERWSEDEPPILKAKDGTPRLYECIGTRFLIKYINSLDARYPYVDNVKPFSRFLRIFGASALTFGWAPLDAAISVTKMLEYLLRTTVSAPNDLLTVKDPSGQSRPHPLVLWVEEASDGERKRVAKVLREHGFELAIPLTLLIERPNELERLINFLADHPQITSNLGQKDPALLGENAGTLTLTESYDANETQDLYIGAIDAAIAGVNTVAMGHTHEPVERLRGFSYFNTGSWTRYYRFSDTEPTRPWAVLRNHSYEDFPYSLQYVLVRPSAEKATVETWAESPNL